MLVKLSDLFSFLSVVLRAGTLVFQSVLLGGLAWAAGNVQADVKSNFNEAAPEAKDRAIKSDQA